MKFQSAVLHLHLGKSPGLTREQRENSRFLLFESFRVFAMINIFAKNGTTSWWIAIKPIVKYEHPH